MHAFMFKLNQFKFKDIRIVCFIRLDYWFSFPISTCHLRPGLQFSSAGVTLSFHWTIVWQLAFLTKIKKSKPWIKSFLAKVKFNDRKSFTWCVWPIRLIIKDEFCPVIYYLYIWPVGYVYLQNVRKIKDDALH